MLLKKALQFFPAWVTGAEYCKPRGACQQTGCLTLDKSLHHPEPESSSQKSGDETYLTIAVRIRR
jgi:hypothetical protein